jgi:hypothetical protein
MLERLQLAHPDFYTLPNFVEIQSFVSQCFNREKDGNSEEPIPNSTSQRWQRGNGVVEVMENEEIEEAIAMVIVHYYHGGNILPKYVLSILRDQFSSAAVDSRKYLRISNVIVAAGITTKETVLSYATCRRLWWWWPRQKE